MDRMEQYCNENSTAEEKQVAMFLTDIFLQILEF